MPKEEESGEKRGESFPGRGGPELLRDQSLGKSALGRYAERSVRSDPIYVRTRKIQNINRPYGRGC